MMSRPRFWCLIVLIVGCHANLAWCQAGEGSSSEEARRLMEQAFEADAAGDKDAAIALYRRSFETHPSYDVAGNLGVLLFKAEGYVEAAKYLSYCLRNFPVGGSVSLKDEIGRQLEKAKTYVGRLKIQVSEDGASVAVDGVDQGTSPLIEDLYLEPGRHEVVARKGESLATEVVESPAGTEVFVMIRLPQSIAQDESVGEYEAGRESAAPWWPAYVVGGLSAAALGTSIGLRVMAADKKDEAESLMTGDPSSCSGSSDPRCQELARLARSQATLADWSDGLLVGGLAGAGITLGYATYLLLSEKKSEPKASVSVGPGGALFVLRGKF